MSIPFAPHTAAVEPYEGSSAYGDIFGDPVTVPCYFEQVRNLVTTADGDQAVSGAHFYTDPPGTPFTLADGTTGVIPAIPTGSRVTANGYTSTVITVSNLDDGGLTGLAHQEILLK